MLELHPEPAEGCWGLGLGQAGAGQCIRSDVALRSCSKQLEDVGVRGLGKREKRPALKEAERTNPGSVVMGVV